MKYVTFTTAHLGGLCLWNTAGSDFNSVKSPAHRDLVAEIASACAKRQLGLFLYVPQHFENRRRVFPPTDGSSPNYRPLRSDCRDLVRWHRRLSPASRTLRPGAGTLLPRSNLAAPVLGFVERSSADGTDFLAPEHTVGDLHSQHPELPVEVYDDAAMQPARFDSPTRPAGSTMRRSRISPRTPSSC